MSNNDLVEERKFRLVEIDSEKLRRAYGHGRYPIKISFIPSTFFGLEQIGAIKTEENPTTGKKVACRGGNGSAFADLAVHIMLYLYTDYGSDEASARNDALYILRILDQAIINAEDTDVVRENFRTILSIVTGQRSS